MRDGLRTASASEKGISVGDLVVAVNKVRPINSTNIELALKDVALYIHNHLGSFC